ncbi:hypothetical protein BDV34DRAFT_230137 [Aspergillus parasiticus]|uniref:Uncharacterized protein n=1 Tax=Aspergillus parasiticus TaxID=5067 RepID=A0A5N6D981_ASPPA|nr:hypothetical protein BDV34DRAFT_230137 [Aspergillus parasiticus]
MAYFGLPQAPHPRGAEVYRRPLHHDIQTILVGNEVFLLDETPRFMVRRPGLTRRRRSYGSEKLCQDEFSGTGDIIEGEFSLGSSDRDGGSSISA